MNKTTKIITISVISFIVLFFFILFIGYSYESGFEDANKQCTQEKEKQYYEGYRVGWNEAIQELYDYYEQIG